MKQDVNYILHHKNVNFKMSEDNLTCIDIGIYNAIFLIWNNHNFDTEISLHRNDVMKLAKVGNATTYTSSLKKLHEKNYLIYKPSFNPLIGSKVTLYRFDKGSVKGSVISSGNAYDNGSGKGSATFIKQYNNLTLKQINLILAHANSFDKSELNIFLKSLKKENTALLENKSVFSFDEFWSLYPKKSGKEPCIKKYEKISETDRQNIKETLADFIKFKPFETYTHPNPLTYLNQKRWNDEIKNNQSITITSIKDERISAITKGIRENSNGRI